MGPAGPQRRSRPAVEALVAEGNRVQYAAGRCRAAAAALAAAAVLAACATTPAGSSAARGRTPASTASGGSAGTSSGSAATRAGTSFGAAGCPSGHVQVQQQMDGSVTGCLRVGDLAPGPHQVTLRQVLLPRQAAAAGGSGATTSAASTGGAPEGSGGAGPSVTVRLQPASGPPGTAVTVVGTVASALSRRPSYTDACWDGCRAGVQYSAVPLTWTSPTAFRATVVVPGGPWMEADPDRVVRPTSGRYRIGVQCLTVVGGCALGAAEGSATFTLEASASSAAWCATGPTCARLAASPARVLPGDVVKVTGRAPIVSVIGSDQPFAFELHVAAGAGGGPEVTFTGLAKARAAQADAKARAAQVDFGHATFTVGTPPPLAGVDTGAAGVLQVDGLAPIATEPGDPSVVGWCGNGHVTVDGPGARRTVPLAAAATTLSRLGYGLMGSQPRCAAVTPLAEPAAGPPSVAAAFTVSPDHQAPPVVDVALVTTDGGSSWQPVPVPPGAQRDGFGGFVARGTALDARFAPASGPGSSPPAGGAAPAGTAAAGGSGSQGTTPLVERTTDGGASWRTVPFACPATGPCVRFGAYRPGNCAMNGTTQPLLHSAGSGLWAAPGWPASVQACMPATLASLGARTELLVDAGSPYLVLDSTDGGTTWQVLGVPPVPGVARGTAFSPGGAGGLLLLPDGALLAWQDGGNPTAVAWHLLRAGSHAWCDAGGAFPTGGYVTDGWPVVLGSQLWWETSQGTAPATTTVQHLAVSAIRC